MNLDHFLNEWIEVDVTIQCENQKITRFYHGLLKKEDQDSITISDIKEGEITINKSIINKVKKMSDYRIRKRSTSIINELDRKLQTFRENI